MWTRLLGTRLRQEEKNVPWDKLGTLVWESRRSHVYVNCGPACLNLVKHEDLMYTCPYKHPNRMWIL